MLLNISQREYKNETYTCVNFSNDMAEMLASEGFQSFLITGRENETTDTWHRYIAVAIEHQTGEMVRLDEFEPMAIHYIYNYTNNSIQFKRVRLK